MKNNRTKIYKFLRYPSIIPKYTNLKLQSTHLTKSHLKKSKRTNISTDYNFEKN